MAMELLTKELREQIPPIGSQEHIDDPLVRAKFFKIGRAHV